VARHPKLKATISATAASPGEPELTGVGLCLSGGGSRALTAGLGQMRGLHQLQANGRSLLSQVSAVSTVSGGSWLGVPWVYLPPEISDEDYLNGYVSDPGRLVLHATDGHSLAETLDQLPDHNPGHNIGKDFSIAHMVWEMIALKIAHDTPWDLMWQIIIAQRMLGPYGLYESGDKAEPTSLFSSDQTTLEDHVLGPNPSLAKETAHLVRPGRPYLICNSAMFVTEPKSEFEFLAPVQATPLSTGIVGTPTGHDANGRLVGGGSVSSFAFDSALSAISGEEVTVEQSRPLSLTDIVGISSAAFAEKVQNYLESVQDDAPGVHAEMQKNREELLLRLKKHSPKKHHSIFDRVFDSLKAHVVDEVLKELSPKDLVPHYL
jgi:hypothetical protein